jgi:tetratricopeptide (TPR) repeat protein
MADHLHLRPSMRLAILTVLAASAGWAADEQQLALALKAQADFDRVQLSPLPQLRDTSACIQTQAALLPVASRTEMPLVRFHKGFCTLMRAAITHQAADLQSAAADFDAAVQAWPARIEKPPKGIPIEPVSSALPVLASIARLEAGVDDRVAAAAQSAIEAALEKPACPSSVMATADCQGILQIGRQWLGWIALRGHRFDEAAKDFSGSGWSEWVAGRQAFDQRNYRRAAEQYRLATQAWDRLAAQPAPALAVRLGPQPDLGLALSELGGAQLLAGDTAAAIATLDTAIKRDPDHAWSFYLRARAKEAAGQSDAALIDYNLASRTAFAGAKDLVSGEAHLYRGMLLYRRKDFSRAEDEFASALNFDVPANLRPDAVAWRHLATVAGGACGAGRDQLQRALPAASPFFPANEAQAAIAACPATAAVGPGAANGPK